MPEDYLEYFKQRNVALIMRLNKKYYSAERFEKHGIHVEDMHYRDGSVPPIALLQRFLRGCEEATVNIGVHCKAGLGRTGTCMGAYMQKHFGFTAAETIAWIRICRPGSIIGPQQHFLEEIQEQMWREGEEFRRRRAAGESGGASSVRRGALIACPRSALLSPPHAHARAAPVLAGSLSFAYARPLTPRRPPSPPPPHVRCRRPSRRRASQRRPTAAPRRRAPR